MSLELQERLRYDTPFWAGGVTRNADGSWRTPKAGEFQGVAKIVCDGTNWFEVARSAN